MRVLLLCGGRSREHEVSRISASYVKSVLLSAGHSVIEAEISRSGSWCIDGAGLNVDMSCRKWLLRRGEEDIGFDVVFPVLHGPFGEDGTVQGLCEMARWAYAGADVMTSSMAMDKSVTKKLMQAGGLDVLPWKTFFGIPEAEDVRELGLPLFIKPCRLGSSVGITRVDDYADLEDAARRALRHDSRILAETGLDRPREIEVALLSEGGVISSSVPGEIVPGREWYDFEAKYDCEDSRLLIPAPLKRELFDHVRTAASRSFAILKGSGFARADFLLDRSGRLYFNEINTIPGFTEISMFPKLWKATGVEPEAVMDRILAEALLRQEDGGCSTRRDPEGV